MTDRARFLPPNFPPRTPAGNRLPDGGGWTRILTRERHTMHRRMVVALLVLLLAPAGGCSRAAQTEGEEPDPFDRANAVLTVRVVNHSQLDATIYLVHDGARDRLGSVTAATTSEFTVRGRSLATGDFTLMADPLGGTRTVTTERLNALQGTEFIWTIESEFSRSSVMVRD
jgi:hypothetical protein